MNFKELLSNKNITGYALAKGTGIPYTTINDLINGKTTIQNASLKNALLIANYLKIDINELAQLNNGPFIDFRYFRNNLLSELKRNNQVSFIESIIKKKEIDYYYKNNGKEYALYLLALIDYLCRINKIPIYTKRYNNLRKEKLEKPFFVGGSLLKFNSIEEAENTLQIKVISEFKQFNIIEEDVFNVT